MDIYRAPKEQIIYQRRLINAFHLYLQIKQIYNKLQLLWI